MRVEAGDEFLFTLPHLADFGCWSLLLKQNTDKKTMSHKYLCWSERVDISFTTWLCGNFIFIVCCTCRHHLVIPSSKIEDVQARCSYHFIHHFGWSNYISGMLSCGIDRRISVWRLQIVCKCCIGFDWRLRQENIQMARFQQHLDLCRPHPRFSCAILRWKATVCTNQSNTFARRGWIHSRVEQDDHERYG